MKVNSRKLRWMRRGARRYWSASEISMRAYYAWQEAELEVRQLRLNALVEKLLTEIK
jgi:hypothetical protein